MANAALRAAGRVREWVGEPGSRETFAAFAVFSVLLLGLGAIVGQLAFRDLSRIVWAHRIRLEQDEARYLADAVAAIGRDRDRIDFFRVRRRKAVLESVIAERIAVRPFVSHVEVLDRFGGPIVRVARASPAGGAGMIAPPDVGEEIQTVTVQLRRGRFPEGEVRIGIAEGVMQRHLSDLRRSLQIKLAIAAGLALAIVVAGLAFVIYLLRKNRRLEREQQAANRRAQVAMLGSGLAHEIRNPLNAMNLNLQMLDEELSGMPGFDRNEHGDLLDSIQSEIKRLERLVNNFLLYSRPAVPNFEPHDLNRLLEAVARFLQPDFRHNDVELSLDLEPMLPSVELDEPQFKQAVMNLLVNARQVLHPGGRVHLRSRVGPDGGAVVEVADDGPGIPDETRDMIFEVFYSNRGGGTGLGLPIARQIVEKHGGRIELETEVGNGTTFRIRLPRRHPEGETGKGREEEGP